MTALSRYDVGEKDFGLIGNVLKNKLQITDQKTLSDMETVLLSDTYTFYTKLAKDKKIEFTSEFIFELHHYFLGTLYDWAGKVRAVNISKGGCMFAPAERLGFALKEFDSILQKNEISPDDPKNILAKKLAIITCELNFIHPFREGNGRTNRLFVDLMLLQNGHEFVDYSLVSTRAYISACVYGMEKEYDKMQRIFMRCLKNKKV